MHFVHAKTRFPLGSLIHWRLGYFLLLTVGLNFPRSFFNFQLIADFFPQIVHCFAINFPKINFIYIFNNIYCIRFFFFFQYHGILVILYACYNFFFNCITFLNYHSWDCSWERSLFIGRPHSKKRRQINFKSIKTFRPVWFGYFALTFIYYQKSSAFWLCKTRAN